MSDDEEFIQFKDVRFQWEELLITAPSDVLNDTAKLVAFRLTRKHTNGSTNSCWPSLQTLADALGKNVRTMSRAVRMLEKANIIQVRRDKGRSKPNFYTVTQSSLRKAKKLSSKGGKPDNIVPFNQPQAEQNQTDLSKKPDRVDQNIGQECLPNLSKEHNLKNLSPEREKDIQDFQLTSISAKTYQGERWHEYFIDLAIYPPDWMTTKHGYLNVPARLPEKMPAVFRAHFEMLANTHSNAGCVVSAEG